MDEQKNEASIVVSLAGNFYAMTHEAVLVKQAHGSICSIHLVSSVLNKVARRDMEPAVPSSEPSNERVNRTLHDALAESNLGDDTRLSSSRALLYFVKFLPEFISSNAEQVGSDTTAHIATAMSSSAMLASMVMYINRDARCPELLRRP